MRIDPADELAGVPVVAVRDFLRRHGEGFTIEDATSALSVSEDHARRMVDELRARDYLSEAGAEGHVWVLTLEGSSLANATAALPVRRATAQHHLDAFLQRVEEVNEDTELLHWCTEVWLFGSMLDPSRESVSDVDVAIRLVRRIDEAFLQASQEFARRQQRNGRRFSNYLDFLSAPKLEMRRRLKARSPVLSIHDADTDEGFQRSASRLLYRYDPPPSS